MDKKILVPTDGSEPARDAAGMAIQLASKLGLGIVALRVIDVDRYAADFAGMRESVGRDLEEQAARILDEVRQMASGSEVEVDTQVRHGDSSREIIRFAQEDPDVTMIVMGASGRRRLGRQLIGSTAERVVRQVGRDLPCAVIVAPSTATTPEARLQL